MSNVILRPFLPAQEGRTDCRVRPQDRGAFALRFGRPAYRCSGNRIAEAASRSGPGGHSENRGELLTMDDAEGKIVELLRRKKDLNAELAATVAELKATLDAHYGLIGQIVTLHDGRRFKITYTQYTDRGVPFKVTGPLIKKDGSESLNKGSAYPDWRTGEIAGLEPV